MIESVTITDTTTGQATTSGVVSLECGLLGKHSECDTGNGFVCSCAHHRGPAIGTEVHMQPMNGTIHAVARCSVVRGTRYSTSPTVMSDEVADYLADGRIKFCKKCYPVPAGSVPQ